jgi:hypothetical protein
MSKTSSLVRWDFSDCNRSINHWMVYLLKVLTAINIEWNVFATWWPKFEFVALMMALNFLILLERVWAIVAEIWLTTIVRVESVIRSQWPLDLVVPAICMRVLLTQMRWVLLILSHLLYFWDFRNFETFLSINGLCFIVWMLRGSWWKILLSIETIRLHQFWLIKHLELVVRLFPCVNSKGRTCICYLFWTDGELFSLLDGTYDWDVVKYDAIWC